MPQLVLFNTGWMTHYRGQTATDRVVNGGQWVQVNKKGGEVWNFLPVRGQCRAYVRTPRGGPLNLGRIGEGPSAEWLDGVTVVFVARKPGGGSVVVGWYRNARVYQEPQRGERGRGWTFHYHVTARARDCVLLAPDERVFLVPRARGRVWGMGQSNVRYMDDPAAKRFIARLHAYMKAPARARISGLSTAPAQNGGAGAPRQSDPQLRAEVEKAAVRRVVAHFKRKGYECRSVERDNVGWDIEVTGGAVRLLVEVKGCSGELPIVELTPNEYLQMQSDVRRAAYRLAIVTRALHARRSVLSIISFNIADASWRDERGRLARLFTRTAARVVLQAHV